MANPNHTTIWQLFLIDSLGALLSAIMLGLVLPMFEGASGMPAKVLYILATIALLFAVYSGLCYRYRKPAVFLQLIATANLLYCCLTATLAWHFYPQLTVPGLVYFGAEIAVIVGLASWEWRASRGTAL